MKFLGCLFVSILALVLSVLFALRNIISLLFKSRKQWKTNFHEAKKESTQQEKSANDSNKKIPTNEGEYVDFEEIKDNK